MCVYICRESVEAAAAAAAIRVADKRKRKFSVGARVVYGRERESLPYRSCGCCCTRASLIYLSLAVYYQFRIRIRARGEADLGVECATQHGSPEKVFSRIIQLGSTCAR